MPLRRLLELPTSDSGPPTGGSSRQHRSPGRSAVSPRRVKIKNVPTSVHPSSNPPTPKPSSDNNRLKLFTPYQQERLSEVYHQHHEDAQSFWGVHTMVESCGITISPDLLAECLSHIGIDASAVEFVSEEQFLMLVQDIMFGENVGQSYYEGDDQLLDLVYECELGGNEPSDEQEQEGGGGGGSKAFPLVKIQDLLRRFRLEDTIFQQIATKQKPVRQMSLSDSQTVLEREKEKEKKKVPFVPLVTLEKLKKCLHAASHEDGSSGQGKKGHSISATAALAQLLAEHHDNQAQHHVEFNFGNGAPLVVVDNPQAPRGRTPEKAMNTAMTRIRMASTVTQSLQHLLDFSKNPNAAASLLGSSSHLVSSRTSVSVPSHGSRNGPLRLPYDMMSVDQRTRPDTASSASSSTDDTATAKSLGGSTSLLPAKSKGTAMEKAAASTPTESMALAPDPTDIIFGLSRKLLDEFQFDGDNSDNSHSGKFHREGTLPFHVAGGPQVAAMTSFSRIVPGEAGSLPTPTKVPIIQIREKRGYSKPWNEKVPVYEPKQLTKSEQDRKATMRMSVEELQHEMSRTDKSVLRALSPKVKLQLQQSPVAATGSQTRRIGTPALSSPISRPTRLAPLASPSKMVEKDLSPGGDTLMARWLTTSAH